MKVKQIMRKDFPYLMPNDSLIDAIELLLNIPESAVPVIDENGNLLGEVNQRDFLLMVVPEEILDEVLGPDAMRLLTLRNAKVVKQVMKPIEATLNPNDDVEFAAKLMYEENFVSLPVVSNNKVIGIVTEIDILKHYKRKLKELEL